MMSEPKVYLRSLLQQITKLDHESFQGDDDLRAEFLASARNLSHRLERPWDSILRMIYMEVCPISALSFPNWSLPSR